MNDTERFSISECDNAGVYEIVVKNNETKEYAIIIPESGARLKELNLSNGQSNLSVLKKVIDIKSRERDAVFTNAKLSPFAGRIKDGTYEFNDVKYSLPLNYAEESNACHGLVYDKKFEIVNSETQKDYAKCTLRYNYNGDNEGYPFEYSIDLTYKLTAENGLICLTQIKNNSDEMIPISDGWHHYFDLGLKVDDLKLNLSTCREIELDDRNTPAGALKNFDDFSLPGRIGDRKFDSCFKLQQNGNTAVTKLISEELDLVLNIWQETGDNKYGYCLIYTPPGRKSIAIEPMTSNVDSFNNGEGLIKLKPGEQFESMFGIYLSRVN